LDFELLRTYLDKKFIEQKQEFENKIQLQHKQNARLLKVSAKPEVVKQFKFKGNQIQFDFNNKLTEDICD